MAQSIARVVLIGNLTKDPELKQTAGGMMIASLRVACNSRRKVGEAWTEVPGYYDVTVFGQQAENTAKYLSKGRPVGIDGRLDYREWTTPEGVKRSAVQIIADSVQFLGGGEARVQQAPAPDISFEAMVPVPAVQSAAVPVAAQVTPEAVQAAFPGSTEDDDVPF